MKYLLCYDVKNAKRLRRVAKIMEGTGYRVQKSVFEAFLNPNDLRKLMERLTMALHIEKDSVRVYRLCESCNREIKIIGAGEQVESLPFIII